MKKLLAILFVFLMSFTTLANQNIQQWDRYTGVGRLATTIEKRAETEVNITNIVPVSVEPAEWTVTLQCDKSWINGNWKVVMTNNQEAPKGGFWFVLYDAKWKKLGVCAATKIK